MTDVTDAQISLSSFLSLLFKSRHDSRAKMCYSNGNVKFENFMHIEWSEEKFLKGFVGDKTRLRFRYKHQKIELLFTQMTHYNRMHERVFKYQKPLFFLLARIYTLLAA